MNGIEKQAAFYRAYLIDDRSLAPLTTALATIVGLWLLVYVVSAIGGAEANQQMIPGRGACVLARVAISVTVVGRTRARRTRPSNRESWRVKASYIKQSGSFHNV